MMNIRIIAKKITLLSLLFFVCACSAQTNQRLSEFFEEERDPDAKFKVGGSFEREINKKYSAFDCNELLMEYQRVYEYNDAGGKIRKKVIWNLARENNCVDIIQRWDNQKEKEKKEEEKIKAKEWKIKEDKRYKDDLRREEWFRKEREKREKESKERRERVLREIRNEK